MSPAALAAICGSRRFLRVAIVCGAPNRPVSAPPAGRWVVTTARLVAYRTGFETTLVLETRCSGRPRTALNVPPDWTSPPTPSAAVQLASPEPSAANASAASSTNSWADDTSAGGDHGASAAAGDAA